MMREEDEARKYIILVIYDIVDNKHRLKFSKLLEKYGNRVQKSAFEARLTMPKYLKLKDEIEQLLREEDNVRIYKLYAYEEVQVYGSEDYSGEDDVVII